jgi:hypothetical protein
MCQITWQNALFQACAAVPSKSSLFCVVAQGGLIVANVTGNVFAKYPLASSPETPATHYQHTPRNIPEERRPRSGTRLEDI